jgi:hypothetical protein
MPNLTPSQLEAQFQKLPEDIREFLATNGGALIDIGREYQLSGQQILILSRLILEIFIGSLPLTELIGRLEKELEIPKTQAAPLAETLRDQLLQPYLEFLRKTYSNLPSKQKMAGGADLKKAFPAPRPTNSRKPPPNDSGARSSRGLI